ncbi:MAG: hypothetical protein GX363_04385 [Clostridiales bacterium]|nr:hypothetical protein [Clostridiales bacterium]
MKNLKKLISLLLILVIVIGSSITVYADIDIEKEIEKTSKYLIQKVQNPYPGMIGGEWLILGLTRSGFDLPHGYIDKYYGNLEDLFIQKQGEITRNKYSDYSRIILALTAIGKDVSNVAGYNPLEKLDDFESVKKQGINGPQFALIAKNSGGYDLSSEKALLNYILDKELPGGGFCLSGSIADPDITAIAIQAISAYKDQKEIKEVIDRALDKLLEMELDNAESLSQAIIALTSMGIDPEKYGYVTSLLNYRLKDGSFRHELKGDSDFMPTEQALLALAAYKLFTNGESTIYDMKDVNAGKLYKYKVLLNGRYMVFDQPPINVEGRVLVPMRAIFESLGATVKWEQDIKRVTGTLDDINVILTIGDKKVYLNNKEIDLDVPALVQNGRTMVPVRFISESLNAKVDWDADTSTVIITKE